MKWWHIYKGYYSETPPFISISMQSEMNFWVFDVNPGGEFYASNGVDKA